MDARAGAAALPAHLLRSSSSFCDGVVAMRAPPVPERSFCVSKLKVISETTLEVPPPSFLRVRTNSSKIWLLSFALPTRTPPAQLGDPSLTCAII